MYDPGYEGPDYTFKITILFFKFETGLLNYRKTILSLLFLLIQFQHSFAQKYTYTFFTAADGLPSSEILSIAKDTKGQLWAGTIHGLSKYDGYTFTNYLYAIDGSLIGAVNMLKADSNRIWIGATTGLYCLLENKIIKISSETSSPQSVHDILPDFDNHLWLATSNGPVKISMNKIDYTGKTKINIEENILPQWKKSKFAKESDDIILIKNAEDGSLYFSSQYEIYRLLKDELIFIYAAVNLGDKILSLFPVSKSKIFYDGALSEMNKIENGIATNIFRVNHYTPGLKAGNDSTWYAGTTGIFCFHPQLEQASVYINTMEDAEVLWPTAMIKEKDGFWLASHQGLIKIKPSLFEQYDLKTFQDVQEVYSFYQTKNGTLLTGANRGKIYKKERERFTNFFPANKTAVSLAEIRCMYEDEDERLWIGTGYQGIALYNKGNLSYYTKAEGLHDNSINNFLKTKSGKFYAFGDHGLSEIKSDSQKNISFVAYPYPSKLSQQAHFYNGVESPDGTLWVAGEEGLFFLKNNSLHEFLLNNKKVQAADIRMDNNNKVWIAVDGEGILLCHFDNTNTLQLIKKYNKSDGLATDMYLRLLIDKDNNVWAGSAKGISCIITTEKQKERVLNFDENDGFIKPGYFSLNLFEEKSGKIWVGTTNGITSFDSEKLLAENSRPAIFITGISFPKNSALDYDTDSLIQIKLANPLSLSYNNNSIKIDFTALDFSNQHNLTYFYKLEGTDTEWLRTENKRSITYQNLSPGKYRFLVKAKNSKGIWSEETAEFSFTIQPPFWQRWWFVALCLFAGASILYFIYKRRVNNIRNKEAQKTEIEKLKAVSYQYQLEIEQVVNFFATSINEQESIDDMLWDVAKNCISKLGFEDCVIYLKDENRDMLIQKAAWGPKTTMDDKIINPIEIPIGKGVVGSVALTGKAEIIADTSADKRYIADDANRLSELTVPIIDNGQVIGIIDSENHHPNFYTQRHLQILTTVASLCSEKIDKMKAEQQTREKQLEVLQLSSDLATSQLTALRAQMNPHFIFNALNSIQQFVLQGNVDEANRYLSRFSKLQREILNNSDQQFIPLEKEKEILEIYLQLEQLRFDDSFSYSITIDATIDTDEVMIPPMIIQPFVENAIWHGLSPKKGNKKVIIEFELEDEQTLTCIISDNGVGREASAKLKSTTGRHKSRGLSLVYERLAILKKQYNQPFEVSIADILSPEGDSAGTKITLRLFSGTQIHN